MNQGATKVGWAEEEPQIELAEEADSAVETTWEAEVPRNRSGMIAGLLLALLGVGWMVALGVTLFQASPGRMLPPLTLAAWIGLGSGPLALLAILYLLLLRTGRAEANAYARASARLRADSAGLAQMLALLTSKIDEARAALNDQAAGLQTLGNDAGERIGRAALELSEQAASVGRTVSTLNDATAIAREDLSVLLTEIPNAEAVTRRLAEGLRESGAEADTRARALSELLQMLDLQARQANESTGGAAARLAGQIDRIEASAAAADKRIEDAAGAMGRAIDAALDAAAESLDDARQVIASQSAALNAMVEQGQASVTATGEEATRALGGQLDQLVARVEGIGAGLRSQELAARGLLNHLEQAIATVEAKFAELGDKGAEHTADLAEHIVALSTHADTVGRTLGSSRQTAETLVGRVEHLREQAEASSSTLTDAIPAALARVRLHAEQSLQAIATAGTRAENLSAVAATVAERLTEAEALLERQRAAIGDAEGLAEDRLTALTEQTRALQTLLVKADAEVRSLSEGASGHLAEALNQVRDTATQAADQARDTLSGVIPRVAQRMSESAARAMSAALADVGKDEIAAVGAVSEQAVKAAHLVAERLSRQLLTIAETATAIEARIEANRADTEAHDDQSFARTAGLLIEALNSTAIDVAKIFSNEVTDEEWKAYLRGDRGIFTRRAVKLIDRSEANLIVQRYNEDGEFRELVNRYIHDFEALLRRVMATREGTAIATTMLSSDTGKLYVALAQAIERLRK
jgi:hypothetical protein